VHYMDPVKNNNYKSMKNVIYCEMYYILKKIYSNMSLRLQFLNKNHNSDVVIGINIDTMINN